MVGFRYVTAIGAAGLLAVSADDECDSDPRCCCTHSFLTFIFLSTVLININYIKFVVIKFKLTIQYFFKEYFVAFVENQKSRSRR